ncbi:unnamed protein product [Pleuronectes platessa]|uniref:Uncharacterized protein n=1 Tax=Pleuronectes platessa TaxID=8262 RepID=A0A9N7W3D3_PLEPL|nr:unnamed protein product [Pleuronectes platessa]
MEGERGTWFWVVPGGRWIVCTGRAAGGRMDELLRDSQRSKDISLPRADPADRCAHSSDYLRPQLTPGALLRDDARETRKHTATCDVRRGEETKEERRKGQRTKEE